jgi:hypothetical protein
MRIRLTVFSAVLLSLAVQAGAASGPPLPRGPEIRVNNGAGSLSSARVAVFPDGGFVVVWRSQAGVRQRFFDRKGKPAGGEQPLSLGIAGTVNEIVADRDGSFVVVWTDLEERDGVSAGVYGRAFTANGVPRTGDFLINTSTEGAEYAPAIAAARHGPVVVVWTQNFDENGPNNLFARVLSAEP